VTPRTYLERGDLVRVFCADCGHEGRLDLESLVAAGRGDLSMHDLRYRCRATRLVPDGPGVFACGGARVRFIIQPHWERRQK
jgi:hypothetical protein